MCSPVCLLPVAVAGAVVGLAQQLLQQISQSKSELPVESYADADAPAVQWLQTHGYPLLVHGHTHKPQDHDLPGTANNGQTLRRMVLSDWDLLAPQPRAEAMRLQRQPDGAWRWSRESLAGIGYAQSARKT